MLHVRFGAARQGMSKGFGWAAAALSLSCGAFAVGAIAVDDEVGETDPGYGFSTGHDDKESARKGAMAECKKAGNDNCKFKVWFETCGAYAASKGGGLALTKSIAIDYVKHGVRANAVLPCDIATPIFSQFNMPEGGDWKLVKRVMAPKGSGDPSDVAGIVAMLASDDAKHVTGAEVRVDGGCFA